MVYTDDQHRILSLLKRAEGVVLRDMQGQFLPLSVDALQVAVDHAEAVSYSAQLRQVDCIINLYECGVGSWNWECCCCIASWFVLKDANYSGDLLCTPVLSVYFVFQLMQVQIRM